MDERKVIRQAQAENAERYKALKATGRCPKCNGWKFEVGYVTRLFGKGGQLERVRIPQEFSCIQCGLVVYSLQVETKQAVPAAVTGRAGHDRCRWCMHFKPVNTPSNLRLSGEGAQMITCSKGLWEAYGSGTYSITDIRKGRITAIEKTAGDCPHYRERSELIPGLAKKKSASRSVVQLRDELEPIA